MDDKSSLLNQLRIDRTGEVEAGARSPWLTWAGGSVLLIALGALGWWVLQMPTDVAAAPGAAQASTNAAAGGRTEGRERAASVSSAPSSSLLDASGYVVARRQATVSAKIIGRVTEVLIEEGQRVEEGDVIARLDASDRQAALDHARAQLAQAQASLRAARIALEDARPIFRRNQEQRTAGVISEQAFDTARATYHAAEADLAVRQQAVEVARAALVVAQRNKDDTVVRAPFAGVVTVKAAQAGEIVSPSSAGGGFTRTGIGTIVDMDSLEVEVDVSENYINRVSPGQPAIITLNAYPQWQIPAEVIAVVPTADRSKATVKVRVGFKEKDERVLPEMGARVSFLER